MCGFLPGWLSIDRSGVLASNDGVLASNDSHLLLDFLTDKSQKVKVNGVLSDHLLHKYI